MAPMTRAASKGTRTRLERFTVRLPPEMLGAIDIARARRVGNVSRNTWITEAVQEKLTRGDTTTPSTDGGEQHDRQLL